MPNNRHSQFDRWLPRRVDLRVALHEAEDKDACCHSTHLFRLGVASTRSYDANVCLVLKYISPTMDDLASTQTNTTHCSMDKAACLGKSV